MKHLIGVSAGVLVLLVSFSVQTKEGKSKAKRVFMRPEEVKTRFVDGNEIPPKNMTIVPKCGTIAPEGSTWIKFLFGEVMPEIHRVTNNMVMIKTYLGGTMGDEPDMVRKMRMNQLHVVGGTNTCISMICPELCVLEYPFLFDWEPELVRNKKYCNVDYILEKLENSTAKLCEEKGFQYLCTLEAAFLGIASKIQLKSVDDFKKLKFLTFRGDRIRNEINEAIGFGNVIPAQMLDIAQMLQTGMLDSTVIAWYVSIMLQWWPHLQYATDYPLYGFEPGGIFMSKWIVDEMMKFADKWGHLYGIKDGKVLMRRILKITDKVFLKLRLLLRADEVKARETLLSKGYLKEIHFPESELEKLKQRVVPLYEKYADKKYPRSFDVA